jgi:hypothetical protein
VGPGFDLTMSLLIYALRFNRQRVTILSAFVAISSITISSHHTPQAILLGLEGRSSPASSILSNICAGSDPETIDTGTIPTRYATILQNKTLFLAGHHRIHYDMDQDMLWRWDQVLNTHPNGMRFSCFDEAGDLLATNEYFR